MECRFGTVKCRFSASVLASEGKDDGLSATRLLSRREQKRKPERFFLSEDLDYDRIKGRKCSLTKEKELFYEGEMNRKHSENKNKKPNAENETKNDNGNCLGPEVMVKVNVENLCLRR